LINVGISQIGTELFLKAAGGYMPLLERVHENRRKLSTNWKKGIKVQTNSKVIGIKQLRTYKYNILRIIEGRVKDTINSWQIIS
jgi:hypothetical protein